MIRQAIYKAEVSTPFGIFLAVVLEAEPFARETIGNLVQTELKLAWGQFRVGEVKKSNRRILASISPVKGAHSCDAGQWGWLKRIQS